MFNFTILHTETSQGHPLALAAFDFIIRAILKFYVGYSRPARNARSQCSHHSHASTSERMPVNVSYFKKELTDAAGFQTRAEIRPPEQGIPTRSVVIVPLKHILLKREVY